MWNHNEMFLNRIKSGEGGGGGVFILVLYNWALGGVFIDATDLIKKSLYPHRGCCVASAAL